MNYKYIIEKLQVRHSIERLKKDLHWFLVLLQAFIFLASLGPYIFPSSYYLDLFVNFRLQYLIIACYTLIYFLSYKARYLTLLALITLAVNVYEMQAYYTAGSDHNNSNGKIVRVAMLNVFTGNANKKAVIDQIESIDADILGILEINKKWASELENLSKIYPYIQFESSEDNFGIGLYSKYPLTKTQIKSTTTGYPLSIISEVNIDDKPVQLIVSHPIPPGSYELFNMRNQQLSDISGLVVKGDYDHSIVLGDLNVTPWSIHFKDLLRDAKLKDSRLGYGYKATWPYQLLAFRIPIDFILVKESMMIKSFKIEEILGSDHFAVVADIILTP